jgi:hypothetical protein
MSRPGMTRAEIIASTKLGAARAASDGFGVTPIQDRHVKRLAELMAKLPPERLAKISALADELVGEEMARRRQ